MQDNFDSYVVCLVGSGDPEPFAHFLAESDAAGYARKRINTHGVERAYVFGVATTATGAAITRVARGEAELVERVAGGQMQIEADRRGWERARLGGPRRSANFWDDDTARSMPYRDRYRATTVTITSAAKMKPVQAGKDMGQRLYDSRGAELAFGRVRENQRGLPTDDETRAWHQASMH
jgi:hypothetical protein